MRVAVLHYHARRGGVTSVMAVAASALRARGVEMITICGEPPEPGFEGPCVVDPALAYGRDEDPRALLGRLEEGLRSFGGVPDVWHVHNHSLGKNLTLPRLVEVLAGRGERILLQPHDFAEDFRSTNYAVLQRWKADPQALQAALYPVAPQIRYATLTRRDAEYLIRAGVPREQADVLPNPVVGPVVAQAASMSVPEAGHFVYPVRGIRRKNLGELLYWAAVSGPETSFSITLPPTSEVDFGPYAAWKNLAQELHLPVVFEAGVNQPYEEVLAGADAVLTTSIAEGFGLAYVEPWLTGKPLAGRRIDSVVRDLEQAGMVLDDLYERVPVPLAWIDPSVLESTIRSALRVLYQAYRVPAPADAFERAWRAIVQEDGVDFGRLDEGLQAGVLRIASGEKRRAHPVVPPSRSVTQNAETARSAFDPSRYGERLHQLYDRLAGTTSIKPIDAEGTLLSQQFIDPENLYLLRTTSS